MDAPILSRYGIVVICNSWGHGEFVSQKKNQSIVILYVLVVRLLL